MEVQIKLEGKANKDTWNRAHGFSVDEPLETRFWESQPSLKIGQTALGFSKSLLLNLEPGQHTVTYGVSAHSSTPWDTKILAGDRVLVEGLNSYGNYLSVSFMVLPTGHVVSTPAPLSRIPFFANLRMRIASVLGR